MSNPTDPRQMPGADPYSGNRKIDPVTGYDTTGHDWGGITELNTAFPKVVIWALVLTFLYSVVAWILLPAWPTGRGYTRGLLGLDQSEEAIKGFNSLADRRQDWLSRFADDKFDVLSLSADATLMATAMPAAARLFADNCAACHGTNGQGGPGFPVLSDETWLWSGDAEEIATTIGHGINTEDPDTRYAEMPAFDWMERSDRLTLAEFVSEMPGRAVDFESPAGTLFSENCSSCHGETGAGGLEIGAPSFTDEAVIYGQDRETVMQTLRRGRHGVMPAWSGRLSEAEINLLALFVARLGQPAGGGQ
ncbi:cytochrome-c oxidase, cbb3-type subunit III [Tropicimonas isoalkanivorans]|uniref:Cbb3-type cytochrome c oxidase subunit n=1 Tax=Tropicimonas isoalkanivorans TaxID=441112 RepID=A0A1I1RCQ4_9RHOB|nr:cytochrome-c oxidase, cbb3-type subunit III [Tropicimonas isoalkanivorans]SFD32065.1 cytochrome c oxidase cbb3-type subunit 3 [Tropicimonas isoalkanivorans]